MMKGFDRPLKPTWIYNCLQLINIGDNISEFKEDFNALLWELDGKEGKKKVRTVLYRNFLRSYENPKSRYVEYTPIIGLCKKYPLEKIQPILLFYMIIRSETLLEISKMIHDIYGKRDEIKYPFLLTKVIERFGDRNISGKSLRNFLRTLVSFQILKTDDYKSFTWVKQKKASDLVSGYLLKLYSEELKRSSQVNLNDLENYLFQYFNMPDIKELANKYHNTLWEYKIRLGDDILVFHTDYSWENIK